MNSANSHPTQAASEVLIKTRVTVSDSSVLEGRLEDLSDRAAQIVGATDGLEEGLEVTLTVMFSCAYAIECRCQISQISPGNHFAVKFKSKFKDCALWPEPVPAPHRTVLYPSAA